MTDDATAEQMSTLRAVAHPLRLRMLSLLTGTELSAAEIARELGVTHANASYHLRVLADAGEVVEAGEEKIRGGVAKRYRHPWRKELDASPPGRGRHSRGDLAVYVRTLADELVRRAALKKPGTVAFLSDAEMWVDPEVWERAMGLVREASALVHDQAQAPRSPGTVHVSLSVALHEMTDQPTEETGAGR